MLLDAGQVVATAYNLETANGFARIMEILVTVQVPLAS